MNRQTRTLLVLVVAVLTASIASFAVYRAIARIPVRNVEVATKYAVVAARDMPMGTLLDSGAVKLVPWPARTPLTNGFSDVQAVVNRGLVSSVEENEPITANKIATREAGAGLPPSIPAGMRAMSVKVNEVVGVAGFVVPGTRVDVMVILHQKDDSIARVVVNNVQVLTAGTRFDQENTKQAKPIPSTVITLLVSPEDAVKIALAQAEGQIMLSLRNPMDTGATEARGVRTGALLNSAAAPLDDEDVKPVVRRAPAPPKPVPAAVVAPEPPKAYVVEAIRAAKRTEEAVR